MVTKAKDVFGAILFITFLGIILSILMFGLQLGLHDNFVDRATFEQCMCDWLEDGVVDHIPEDIDCSLYKHKIDAA